MYTPEAVFAEADYRRDKARASWPKMGAGRRRLSWFSKRSRTRSEQVRAA